MKQLYVNVRAPFTATYAGVRLNLSPGRHRIQDCFPGKFLVDGQDVIAQVGPDNTTADRSPGQDPARISRRELAARHLAAKSAGAVVLEWEPVKPEPPAPTPSTVAAPEPVDPESESPVSDPPDAPAAVAPEDEDVPEPSAEDVPPEPEAAPEARSRSRSRSRSRGRA
jgi:hypothetical protein